MFAKEQNIKYMQKQSLETWSVWENPFAIKAEAGISEGKVSSRQSP